MTSLQCLKLSKVAIYLKWMGFLGQNSSLPGLFSSFQRECVYLLGCFFSFKLRSLLRFLAKVRTSFLPQGSPPSFLPHERVRVNSYIVRTFLSSVLIICIPRLSALALILPSFTLSVISTPLCFSYQVSRKAGQISQDQMCNLVEEGQILPLCLRFQQYRCFLASLSVS